MFRNEDLLRWQYRLKEYADAVLTPSPKAGEDFYNCPFCGSGTGPHRTGAFKITGPYFRCFACGEHGDIMALWGKLNNNGTFTEQIEGVAAFFSMRPESRHATEGIFNLIHGQHTPQEKQGNEKNTKNRKILQIHPQDDFSEPAKRYLLGRGFSVDFVKRYKVQYDSRLNYICFPTVTADGGKDWVLRRAADKPNDIFKKRPLNVPGLFTANGKRFCNETAEAAEQARATGKPLFICEGVFDALSLAFLGHYSISINGINNFSLAADYLKRVMQEKGKPLFVCVAFDNDKRGQEAKQKAEQTAAQIEGVHIIPFRCPGGWNDINDIFRTGAREQGTLLDAVYIAEQETRREQAKGDKVTR